MSALNKALKKCEKLTDEQRVALFISSFKTVVDVTENITKDRTKAMNTALTVVMNAVAADGKLEEGEFALLFAFFKNVTDTPIDFVTAKKMVTACGNPNDQIVFIKNYFLSVSEYGEGPAIAFICMIMAVLSIDGDVSFKEKRWMNKIF